MVGKECTFCSRECRYQYRASGKWTPPNKISDEQALSDLLELSNLLKKRPTARDINSVWSFRSILYGRRFGSVENANLVAGITYPHPHSGDQLIAELKRVACLIGHTPTDSEFRIHGSISTAPYWKQFGSWRQACTMAGLIPHTTGEGVPKTKFYDYKKTDGSIVKFQGTYEHRFAIALDRFGHAWMSHGEIKLIQYTDLAGKPHQYRPDFYLPNLSVYYEVKGWYREKDRQKMSLIHQCNPTLKIVVVSISLLNEFEQTGALPS